MVKFHETDCETESYCVVTGKWVKRDKDESYCYWPVQESASKADKMCLKEVDIDEDTFEPFVVTIKYETGTYALRMHKKLVCF